MSETENKPSSSAGHICQTPNCGKPASLQCPTCIKLGIKDESHFCDQNCFTSFWSEHKKIHALKSGKSTTTVYNPWPGFNYTGPLRAYPKSKERKVPPHIMRPDYADHPEGLPLSEIADKKSTIIKVLDDEEIEGLNLSCKVSWIDGVGKFKQKVL
jgi:methionyl aminopeptidase